MHLLNARNARAEDAGEAIDLGQTPGDIVILSAADTELACLAAAQALRPEGAPSLRLANLLQLGHPLSVDHYVERMIAHARLVILRLLGGRSYWAYGLEQLAAVCRANGIPFAALPGDDQPDPELAAWSTLRPEACHRLWQYGVHGGLDNAKQMLAYAASLLGTDEPWQEPAPLLRAGLYWPGIPRPTQADLRAAWRPDRPVAALVFYRALVQAGDLAAIDALIAALAAAGLNALPIFTASLKDPVAAPLVQELLAEAPPAVVLNATGFAVSSPGQRRPDPPRRARPPGPAAGAGRRQRGRLARRHPRPLAPRPRDARGAARDRRPDPEPRGRVQEQEPLRPAHRDRDRRLRAGPGPGPLHGRARGRLGAARRAARRRAQGRDRARQLPQPGRADRQRRWPRCAREHGPPAARAGGRRLSDREPAKRRSEPRRGAAGRRHQPARGPRAAPDPRSIPDPRLPQVLRTTD